MDHDTEALAVREILEPPPCGSCGKTIEPLQTYYMLKKRKRILFLPLGYERFMVCEACFPYTHKSGFEVEYKASIPTAGSQIAPDSKWRVFRPPGRS
jgi:hypothetical protein